MAKVDVYKAGGVPKASPAVVPLSRSAHDVLEVNNLTDGPVYVWMPDPVFVEGTNPVAVPRDETRSFTVRGDAELGYHPYAAYHRSPDREARAGGGEFAVGNSAPGVIIRA